MFENIINFFKRLGKQEEREEEIKVSKGPSKEAAKERLHLVLMQDRANVSADFLDLMKQEIIEVIKKYIEIDESEIDVRLTNKQNQDGSNGAPSLYANIPIVSIKKDEAKNNKQEIIQEENLEIDKKEERNEVEQEEKQEEKLEEKQEQNEEVQQENTVEEVASVPHGEYANNK